MPDAIRDLYGSLSLGTISHGPVRKHGMPVQLYLGISGASMYPSLHLLDQEDEDQSKLRGHNSAATQRMRRQRSRDSTLSLLPLHGIKDATR